MAAKVAAIQMVSTAKVEENLAAAGRLLQQAAERGADLALLPEVFAVLEGGPMAPFGEEQGSGPIQEFLAAQAKALGMIVIGGTIPLLTRPGRSPDAADYRLTDGRVRPASLVYGPSGGLLARYDKIHLFDVTVADQQAAYSESRSYEGGEEIVSLDTGLGHLGLSVCYDLRFPELYRQLFRRGAQLVTVPSAFTRVTGQAHWEVLLRARAIENQCYIIAANQGGRHNAKRETWGHSMIIDPWGKVLDVVAKGEGVAIAEIDLQLLDDIRQRMPTHEQTRLLD
ncbi:MAG: carbon-nitrogen hydrolase family protein [Pseudohongiellaceae bacterium]